MSGSSTGSLLVRLLDENLARLGFFVSVLLLLVNLLLLLSDAAGGALLLRLLARVMIVLLFLETFPLNVDAKLENVLRRSDGGLAAGGPWGFAKPFSDNIVMDLLGRPLRFTYQKMNKPMPMTPTAMTIFF